MNAERESWLSRLSALNTDRSCGAAPHKPLLLLIVCDLVEEGRLVGGLLHRDGALAFRFATLWSVVADRRRTKPDLRLPFYHLKSDGFWQPLDEAGRPAESRERAAIAQLDVSFLHCLRAPERGVEPASPSENANGVSSLSPGLPSPRGYPGSTAADVFQPCKGCILVVPI